MSQKNSVDELWAIVELMGHEQSAGKISASDLGGQLRIDIPIEDGYRTEYYGNNAIFRIRIVSEEIARAYARPKQEIRSFDTPIVTRAQYESALEKHRSEVERLTRAVETLQRRLLSVNEGSEIPLIKSKINSDSDLGDRLTDNFEE